MIMQGASRQEKSCNYTLRSSRERVEAVEASRSPVQVFQNHANATDTKRMNDTMVKNVVTRIVV